MDTLSGHRFDLVCKISRFPRVTVFFVFFSDEFCFFFSALFVARGCHKEKKNEN